MQHRGHAPATRRASYREVSRLRPHPLVKVFAVAAALSATTLATALALAAPGHDHAGHAAALPSNAIIPSETAEASLYSWDYFTNFGHYVARTHCVALADGTPDWPWITILVAFNAIIVIGYLKIFLFWRKSYLAEAEGDRNKPLMHLAYIFLWCAICGYVMSIVMFWWPAYRLLALFLGVLCVVTWKFAGNLGDLKVSLSAKRLQRELNEASGHKMLSLVAAQTDNAVIITDAGGLIEWVNEGFTRITGYTLDEVKGRKPGSFLQGPDTDEDMVRLIRDQIARGGRFDGEILNYAKNGRPYWIEAQISPVRDDAGKIVRFIAVERDVTARKEAERQLRESEERFRLIIGSVLDGVVTMDTRGNVVAWNRRAEEIFGFSAREALDRPLDELVIPPDARADHRRGLQQYLATGAGTILNRRIEVTALRKNGEQFPIELSISPIQHNGETRFTAFVRDISDRKRYEAEIVAAKTAAEAASVAKSQFLANMSHEIRTPLTAIIGFGDLLIQTPDAPTEQRTDWLQTVQRSSRHLLALINDLLDLSKIEAGRMEYERIACSPYELVGDAVSTMRVRAAEKKLDLDLVYAGPIPERVTTDPLRLKQVVMNLLSNAIKFTASGKVTVTVGLDPAAATAAQPRLRIAVSDTGIGIPADKLDSVFEAFVQADASVTRKFGGTGLGLAISRRICRDLGGHLTADSTPGQGSTFTLTVDPGDLAGVRLITSHEAVDSTKPRPTDAAPAAAQATLPKLAGRVLLVDDGPTNRKLVSLLLERAGATVFTAEHGEAALHMIAEAPFDVVLMDMQMPVMDGYTATRELRKRGVTTPVIALTANAMQGDRDTCLEAGCDGYLGKPVDRDQLFAVVADALARKGSATPTAQRSEAAGPNALISTLPLDDPEMRSIVVDFAAELAQHVDAMQRATDAHALDEVARLAHWVKGAGGTAGFADLTRPAADLERHAHADQLADAQRCLDEVRALTRLIQAGVTPATETPTHPTP